MIDLSIIIVNWNTKDLLADCLESLIGIQQSVREVIVVDNASMDGSAGMVYAHFPWVTLIESPDNLGFAAGNNLALHHATGKYVLLLNPDTVVTEGAIERLWQALAAQSKAGIAGAQLLNADGSLQRSIGVFPSLWSELPLINRCLGPVRGDAQVSTPDGDLTVQSVDWVSGACLMIKREVVEDIGLLDESFWLYTEETDWCYRARAAGWDVLLVPQAQVYHLARAASGQRYVFTMLHFHQSRVRFVHKYYGPIYASAMMQVLRLKAAIWRRRPAGSPLRKAYPKLTSIQIVSAYCQLEKTLSLTVEEFLQVQW